MGLNKSIVYKLLGLLNSVGITNKDFLLSAGSYVECTLENEWNHVSPKQNMCVKGNIRFSNRVGTRNDIKLIRCVLGMMLSSSIVVRGTTVNCGYVDEAVPGGKPIVGKSVIAC